VEWAKPYLKPRVGFYQLMDPKLEGQHSTKGAYKATKLVTLCLCRDKKSRPLMSEIVTLSILTTSLIKGLNFWSRQRHSATNFIPLYASFVEYCPSSFGSIN
jgi:hypothetical protein